MFLSEIWPLDVRIRTRGPTKLGYERLERCELAAPVASATTAVPLTLDAVLLSLVCGSFCTLGHRRHVIRRCNRPGRK